LVLVERAKRIIKVAMELQALGVEDPIARACEMTPAAPASRQLAARIWAAMGGR
jgi:hypothetical protein